MKKSFLKILTISSIVMSFSLLTACGSTQTSGDLSGNLHKQVDNNIVEKVSPVLNEAVEKVQEVGFMKNEKGNNVYKVNEKIEIIVDEKTKEKICGEGYYDLKTKAFIVDGNCTN